MDWKATLTNPWVIGGGLGLAALLLISRANSQPSGSVDTTAVSAFNSMNAATAQNYATSTAARVALGQAAYQNSGTVAGFYTNLLSNLAAVQGSTLAALAQSHAGVVSSIANDNAALAIDMANNAARTEQTGIATTGGISTIGTNAVASQRIAQAAAGASIVSSISNSLVGLSQSAVQAARIGATG